MLLICGMDSNSPVGWMDGRAGDDPARSRRIIVGQSAKGVIDLRQTTIAAINYPTDRFER